MYSQRIDLAEESHWLHEGIEQLWYRSAEYEANPDQLKPFLCAGGISVIEHYLDTPQSELAFGTLQTMQ